MERLTFNLKGKVRKRTLEDRSYLVVPMVMLTEGVHEGSEGPLYYPKKELAKNPTIWNHKPIVVYHPDLEKGHTTATDPVVIEAQKVGLIMNTAWRGGKLRAEAWLEESRMKKVDKRVYDAVVNNTMMEVSTGLWTDNEDKAGKWGNEKYQSIARNLQPDHLAILPDQIGACSIKDGAGLLQLNSAKRFPQKESIRLAIKNQLSGIGITLTNNQLSFSDISRKVTDALSAKYGEPGKSWYGWVTDLYEDKVIFYDKEKCYQQAYTSSATGVSLSGDRKEVVRTTEYVPVTNNDSKEKDTMATAKELATKLISNKNSGWEESDREYLVKLPVEKLTKLVGNAKKEADPEDDEDEEEAAPVVKNKKKTKTIVVEEEDEEEDEPVMKKNAKKKLAEDTFAALPEKMQEALQYGLLVANRDRKNFVKAILANKANQFSEDDLKAMKMPMLEKLYAMAAVRNQSEDDEEDEGIMLRVVKGARYDGQNTREPVQNAADEDEEPLVMPSIFKSKSA